MFETLDYYLRLDIAEIEGDLFKAIAAKDIVKVRKYYQKAIVARLTLAIAEAKGL